MTTSPTLSLRPQTQTIGFSRQNRAIGMHLYLPNSVSSTDETAIQLDTLFIGVFHGDEGISAQLLYRWINHMENIGLSPNSRLAPKAELSPRDIPPFAIIPVLNPDGQVLNQRQNAHGVDLNRNFPAQNWIEENQDTIYYSGPAAGSEPETQALITVIERHCPKKIITVHSPYKVINFDGPAKALAEAMAAASGYPVTEDIGYATPGSFGTWAGKERQIPVITLELPDQENLDEQLWQDNHPSLEAALFFNV